MSDVDVTYNMYVYGIRTYVYCIRILQWYTRTPALITVLIMTTAYSEDIYGDCKTVITTEVENGIEVSRKETRVCDETKKIGEKGKSINTSKKNESLLKNNISKDSINSNVKKNENYQIKVKNKSGWYFGAESN